MMERLSAEFEVLTPLFMGEADQTEAGFRPASFKALLRAWFRAAAPSRLDKEPALFGSQAGQCPFLLRLAEIERREWHWDGRLAARFDEGHGKEMRNGLRYLGFPFAMKQQQGTDRAALAPDSRFRLEFVFPRPATAEQRQALLAALWLLGHLGGAGSRSRRGFGSLALRSWDIPWDEAADLPLLRAAANREAWTAGYRQARALFKTWFPPETERTFIHPHLGAATRPLLSARAGPDWATVLNGMGRKLQDFRVKAPPDYQRVKDHVSGLRRVDHSPERAAFGLPLTFRYTSAKGPPATFLPFDTKGGQTLERHGSLLHLRVVALADGLHSLFLRLDGAVPGQAGAPVAPRGEHRALLPAEGNALDRFMDHLKGKA